MSPHYRAAYSGDPRNVPLARNAIASFASVCGFSEPAISEIRLAAGEALSNAVEHGHGQRSAGFAVICNFEDSELLIEIRDNGEGFDLGRRDSTLPLTERTRGFGILIMRRLMDAVSFDRDGTRVRLYRRREGVETNPR